MHIDLSLAALFSGWAMADELQRRLAREGFDDLRFNDGFVFQHLVEAPRSVTDLAARLLVSQQAVSKVVADLERRGYVERRPDPADARARLVTLTARGQEAIERARELRDEMVRELSTSLGVGRVEDARRLLLDVIDALGGTEAIAGRRVRGPR